ncbi:hypothetical protein J6590_027662, partial [Homalodisca vitripennis]
PNGKTLNFGCCHTVAYFIATDNNYHVIYLFKIKTDALRYLGKRRILRWRATTQIKLCLVEEAKLSSSRPSNERFRMLFIKFPNYLFV